jgi:hypothetical protein
MSDQPDGANFDDISPTRSAAASAADLALRLLAALTPATVILLIGRQQTLAAVVLDVVAGTVS